MSDTPETIMVTVEYAFATPADLGGDTAYQQFCDRAGLPDIPGGWGLLMCEKDDDGEHRTLLTTDVDYLRLIVAGGSSALGLGVIQPEKFPISRLGWPDEWRPAS
jgi:hypothetical protein